MGKSIPVDYDQELILKLKILFQQAIEKLSDNNSERVPTFEEFVRDLDVNDRTVKRIFEFLIKETSSDRNRNSPNISRSERLNSNNSNNNSNNNNNNNNNGNNNSNNRNNTPLIHLFAAPFGSQQNSLFLSSFFPSPSSPSP